MTDELLCCACKYGLRIFYGFPLNPQEWRDTDGDGIGDNADLDDDSDEWSDKEEKRAGTNPLDKLSFPSGS